MNIVQLFVLLITLFTIYTNAQTTFNNNYIVTHPPITIHHKILNTISNSIKTATAADIITTTDTTPSPTIDPTAQQSIDHINQTYNKYTIIAQNNGGIINTSLIVNTTENNNNNNNKLTCNITMTSLDHSYSSTYIFMLSYTNYTLNNVLSILINNDQLKQYNTLQLNNAIKQLNSINNIDNTNNNITSTTNSGSWSYTQTSNAIYTNIVYNKPFINYNNNTQVDSTSIVSTQQASASASAIITTTYTSQSKKQTSNAILCNKQSNTVLTLTIILVILSTVLSM